METTLILLKPDTVDRWLVGKIISRIENKWLKISGLKMIKLSEQLINEHYDFLLGKPFFNNIKSYMMRTPIICLAVSWENAIKITRNLIGSTDPIEANPGSIRWDFGLTIRWNLIHASDSEETAKKELNRFFWNKDVFDYERVIDKVF